MLQQMMRDLPKPQLRSANLLPPPSASLIAHRAKIHFKALFFIRVIGAAWENRIVPKCSLRFHRFFVCCDPYKNSGEKEMELIPRELGKFSYRGGNLSTISRWQTFYDRFLFSLGFCHSGESESLVWTTYIKVPLILLQIRTFSRYSLPLNNQGL